MAPIAGGERGAAALGALVLLAVLAAGGGFALQRTLAGGGGSGVEIPLDRRPVAVVDCPGGPPVAELHGGDRIFAIGRHEDVDGWLLIRNPLDPAQHWWIHAEFVRADGPTTALPVLGCDEPATVPDAEGDQLAAAEDASEPDTDHGPGDDAGGAPVPGDAGSPEVTGPPATPPATVPGRGEVPPTSPTTTAAPDTAPPALRIATGTDTIRERDADGFCPEPLAAETTLTADASDPSGIASVVATWRAGGRDHRRDLRAGPVTVGPFDGGTVPGHRHEDVTITVVATDHAGNASTATTTVRVLSARCLG